jgi:hypothetical protein
MSEQPTDLAAWRQRKQRRDRLVAQGRTNWNRYVERLEHYERIHQPATRPHCDNRAHD